MSFVQSFSTKIGFWEDFLAAIALQEHEFWLRTDATL